MFISPFLSLSKPYTVLKMQDKNILFILILLHPPPYMAAQSSLDQFQPNSGDFSPSTIIILIIGIIFMLTGFLAVFLRQFSDGCFGLSIVPPNPEVTADGRLVVRGLEAEAIKALPTYFYSDVKQHRHGKVELECPVCLCEFQDTEALRLLPGCSHVFHPRCIDLWLAAHVTCPICRQSLEEPGSGAAKPHAVIDIPQANDETESSDSATRQDGEVDDHDHHQSEDHEEEEGKKPIVGKFPRSHSTGHSLAGSERFTLRLPEDVQNSLVNRRASYAAEGLTSMLSPRSQYQCGWFSMTPPPISSGWGSVQLPPPAVTIVTGLKNLQSKPVKTSDRLWPI